MLTLSVRTRFLDSDTPSRRNAPPMTPTLMCVSRVRVRVGVRFRVRVRLR